MHVRVLLSRYRAYTMCPECQGARFQPQTLLYRAKWHPPGQTAERQMTLADFYRLTVKEACHFANGLLAARPAGHDPMRLILEEVTARLGYLNEVGLGYLTLDRPTRSLSGGETERVNLTTCLGSRLVNTLFVLDEPSVGLHPRDTARLVTVLQKLRNGGNTVVVVEHEASVMRAADQIIDLGPGNGATGGQVVFQGTYDEILKNSVSLTGRYLARRAHNEREHSHGQHRRIGFNGHGTFEKSISNSGSIELHDLPVPMAREPGLLTLRNVRFRNLKNLTVRIPLGRFVCVTGVSGSGKTTLVREVLYPALVERLKRAGKIDVKASDRLAEDAADETDSEDLQASPGARQFALEGTDSLQHTVLVDQAVLGKTPRSNPAVYTGAFDDIRDLFAQSEEARQRGLNASAFSFNSAQGQCERCRGAGFEKIEMQFLSDVFVRCPDCEGRRYREHILRIKISPPGPTGLPANEPGLRKSKAKSSPALSIGDILESTIDEVLEFLKGFGEQGPARRARQSLSLLQEVGLGYLKLGQPINTLSGGESQRLKLVRELAESGADDGKAQRRTLFLFDEPTTGLHFEDVRVLLGVFKRLVSAGHSVLVIEHNLDVIEAADWVIDLGPEAGEDGGLVVAEGPPTEIAQSPGSHTGTALREHLGTQANLHPITTRA
jgi:excinuclease ABC subunit A